MGLGCFTVIIISLLIFIIEENIKIIAVSFLIIIGIFFIKSNEIIAGYSRKNLSSADKLRELAILRDEV